jgi:isopropylmalate/homocitrate/citramalate synthase
VKRAADCGVKGVVMEIPSSEHLIEYAYKWPMEKAIDLSIQSTLAAKELGLYTVYFTIDATRANMDWFLNLIERVATEGHMDAFTLVDTFGVLSPQGAAYFTRKVKERIKKPLEIHFHADFGLSVANTIAAVLAGAEVIHSTVTGIGERAGNTPMEETVLALLTLYGIDVGIKYNKLNEVANEVVKLTKTKIPSNKPFVGDTAYDIESGILTTWYRNAFEHHPTEVFPVHPKFVGHRMPKVVMGKYSGADNMSIWAEKLGIDVSKITREQVLEALALIKTKSHDSKRLLTENEFSDIIKGILSQKK